MLLYKLKVEGPGIVFSGHETEGNPFCRSLLANSPPNLTGPLALLNERIRSMTSGRKRWRRPWIGHAAASPRAQMVSGSSKNVRRSSI